jgi:hypothetical protein
MKTDPGGEEEADVKDHMASWIKTHTTSARKPLRVGRGAKLVQFRKMRDQKYMKINQEAKSELCEQLRDEKHISKLNYIYAMIRLKVAWNAQLAIMKYKSQCMI